MADGDTAVKLLDLEPLKYGRRLAAARPNLRLPDGVTLTVYSRHRSTSLPRYTASLDGVPSDMSNRQHNDLDDSVRAQLHALTGVSVPNVFKSYDDGDRPWGSTLGALGWTPLPETRWQLVRPALARFGSWVGKWVLLVVLCFLLGVVYQLAKHAWFPPPCRQVPVMSEGERVATLYINCPDRTTNKDGDWS